jgi:hypothetical protein
MKLIQNHFTKAHFFVFLGLWLCFTAWTYWIAEHGIEQHNHGRLVTVTTLGTILGPMTRAISDDCQSCCLAFSLGLFPYCGVVLLLGTIPLFVKLPFGRGNTVVRTAAWLLGLLGWFLGGVSFFHAFS